MTSHKSALPLLTLLVSLLFILSQCKPTPSKTDENKKTATKQKVEAIVKKAPSCNILSQWRGPKRNGIYPDKNLLERWPKGGPKLLWQYNDLGVGYASAAVTDDVVYTVASLQDTSFVVAFNHKGKLLWKKKMGLEFTDNYPGSRGTPIICSDYGYFLTGVGVLYCFDIKNGNVVWQKDIKKEFNGRPHNSGYSENLIVDGDKVICTPTGPETCVVALNRKTGKPIWTSKGNGEKNAYSNPILIEKNGKKIFVIQLRKSIVGIDISNGKRLWKHPMKSDLHSNTPIYKDGHILAIDGWKGRTIKLKLSADGSNVQEVWKCESLAAEQGDAVILGDNIYGADVANYSFNCVDWNTGMKKYKIVRNSKPHRIAIISADSLLYCYSDEGYFYLVNPLDKKFETRGKFKVPGTKKTDHYTHPVIYNGCLYVRHNNSLFVYDISKSDHKTS